MNRVRSGKWAHQLATMEEVQAFIDEALSLIHKYGWEDMTVRPYSYNINIVTFIDGWRDYDKCTHGSKILLLSEMNGLAKILEAWEEHAKQPKLRIKNVVTGKIFEVEEWFAQEMLKDGLAVLA